MNLLAQSNSLLCVRTLAALLSIQTFLNTDRVFTVHLKYTEAVASLHTGNRST